MLGRSAAGVALYTSQGAGAYPDVRLDSPPAILTEVPMRLIGLAVVLALCLTLAPLAAEAQAAGKGYRGGVVAITLVRLEFRRALALRSEIRAPAGSISCD